jgi:S1-C subfamily serine protease
MQSLRAWWAGLSRDDRRNATLFLGIIGLTLPGYGLVLFLLLGPGLPDPPSPRGPEPAAAAVAPTPSSAPVVARPLTPAEVAARGIPSTVLVGVRTRSGMGNGTGVIVDGERVITNAHVVQGATQLVVLTTDGRVWAASVLGQDAKRDVALLHVRGLDGPPARLGDSSRVELLEDVVAIGYPTMDVFENLAPTVTAGQVSKLFAQLEGLDYIQSTAQLNPGNSGGPLLNRLGEVIGINTLRIDSTGGRTAQGVNLAIPINEVKARLAPAAAAPGVQPTPPAVGRPTNRARPQEVVESFYRLATARDFNRAYSQFTPAFQRKHSYAEFEGWFTDKQGIWVQRIQAESASRDSSIVVTDVLSSDRIQGAVVSGTYRERWRVVWLQDNWRIDDLLQTDAIPTSTPPPTTVPRLSSTPTRPPTSALTRTPTSRPALSPSPTPARSAANAASPTPTHPRPTPPAVALPPAPSASPTPRPGPAGRRAASSALRVANTVPRPRRAASGAPALRRARALNPRRRSALRVTDLCPATPYRRAPRRRARESASPSRVVPSAGIWAR